MLIKLQNNKLPHTHTNTQFHTQLECITKNLMVSTLVFDWIRTKKKVKINVSVLLKINMIIRRKAKNKSILVML